MELTSNVHLTFESEPFVARLSRDNLPNNSEAYLLRENEPLESSPPGFKTVVKIQSQHWREVPKNLDCQVVLIPASMGYLEHGDIIKINPANRRVRVIYRKSSPHNSLLTTERCNSNCIMCSQPPRSRDDSYLVQEILDAIPLMSKDTAELGITGGEPTLLQDNLLSIIESAKLNLPSTSLHVLTNGRLFAYRDFAKRVAKIQHPDLMFGIPLYSDIPAIHDFVVQATNAFDQTIRGLLNLGRYRIQSELRFVIHRQTFNRLPEFGRFISRNLPFVNHVALMGLEMMGYTKGNIDALWIDPVEYQRELQECVNHLHRAGLTVSIYNHQLCVLDKSLWHFSRKSISDWKNIYLPNCEGCSVRQECGGFFSSSLFRYSNQIRPL
jgi:His-Xaa-Ser system radical SAM maturase HxsC